MESFESYDFDGDERWLQFLSTIELPNETTYGRESRAMRLAKAKWYKREIDPEFDVNLVRRGGSAAAGDQNPRPPANEGGARQSRPSPSAAQPQQSQGSRASTSQSAGILFWLHVITIALAVASLLPMLSLSRRFYLWGLQVAAGAHMIKLRNAFGTPKLRPFPSSLQSWLQRASSSTDFHYLLLAVVFMIGRPVIGALQPIVTVSVYHAFHYASVHFATHPLWARYGSKANRWLQDHRREALLFNAVAEVTLAFFMTLGLLSPGRSLVQTYFAWLLLKMRYRSPDSSWYHQQVWGLIDQKARPYYGRVALLSSLVARARLWFLS